jgi:Skp family chaperone for outer membrane proteins
MLARGIFLAFAAALMAGPALAQEGTVKVATCNPAKVFEGMDERKVIEKTMKDERDKIEAEGKRRKAEIDQKVAERQGIKPDSDLYKQKNQEIMTLAVNLEVWVRLQQEEMARAEKDNIRSLFDKIKGAVKEVAEQKKIDLVLSERKPELPADLSQLKADQVRALLSQTDVLYSNDKVDITDAVVAILNKKFATPSK